VLWEEKRQMIIGKSAAKDWPRSVVKMPIIQTKVGKYREILHLVNEVLLWLMPTTKTTVACALLDGFSVQFQATLISTQQIKEHFWDSAHDAVIGLLPNRKLYCISSTKFLGFTGDLKRHFAEESWRELQ
jgi:hypothetical protein